MPDLPEKPRPIAQTVIARTRATLNTRVIRPYRNLQAGISATSLGEWVAFGGISGVVVPAGAALMPEIGVGIAAICFLVGGSIAYRKGEAIRRSDVAKPKDIEMTMHQEGVNNKLTAHSTSVGRIGTEFSTHLIDRELDRSHRYQLIHRIDLLDYTSGDFYSVRRLIVENCSDKISEGVIYVESSERKCSFPSTEVEAFETESQRELIVTCLDDAREKRFRHVFKILFPAPLPPGKKFDLSYRIKLPGELEDLSDEDEQMSIFLGRGTKGVARLKFEVCLNFQPRAVSVTCRDNHRQVAEYDGREPIVSPFAVTAWLEDKWNIKWSSVQPCRISIEVDEPRNSLYIIHYKK